MDFFERLVMKFYNFFFQIYCIYYLVQLLRIRHKKLHFTFLFLYIFVLYTMFIPSLFTPPPPRRRFPPCLHPPHLPASLPQLPFSPSYGGLFIDRLWGRGFMIYNLLSSLPPPFTPPHFTILPPPPTILA